LKRRWVIDKYCTVFPNEIIESTARQLILDLGRRATRLRRGAPWLKAMLVQCAWAAARTKATYLHAQFVRLRGRRGPKKAICAVAASILTAAYHMLKDGTFYEDRGAVHFDRRRPETQARRLVKRLAELGFSVELKPAAPVS
jgi:transposase